MHLNCIGEICPMPVIKTKKALQEIGEGRSISVLVDNIEAIENIEKMVSDTGYHYITGKSGENFTITITRGVGVGIEGNAHVTAMPEADAQNKGKAVVVISSTKMGSGDDELGETLLKMFIYSLSDADTQPKALVFYNSGVKVTTDGSNSLDALRALSELDVDILSCGACLKHYNLTDSLKVGRVSNMYEISELLLNAASVVTV